MGGVVEGDGIDRLRGHQAEGISFGVLDISEVVDANEVGVRESPQDEKLGLQGGAQGWGGVVKDFEDYGQIPDEVEGAVGRGGATVAEDMGDAVAMQEQFTGLEWHGTDSGLTDHNKSQ